MSISGYQKIYCSNGINFFCEESQISEVKKATLVEIFNKISQQQSVGADKRMKFHLVKDQKDYLLIVDVHQQDPQSYVLKNLELCSYTENAKRTEKEFLKAIQKYPKIKEEEEVASPKPISLDFGVRLILSAEIKSGIKGERGEDHCISPRKLYTCLQMKKDEIRKFPEHCEEELDFYFIDRGKILNIFGKKFKEGASHSVVIYTAYTLSYSSFKNRFNRLSNVQLQDRIDSFPEITFGIDKK